MLPLWVKKMGKLNLVMFITLFACLFSLGTSWSIRYFVMRDVQVENLVIALIIPLLLTPGLGMFFFKVLFQLDIVTMQFLELSNTDELTGVPNRRYFDEHVQAEIERANRSQQVFSVLMFDIDDFKQINDRYGHPAGDAILKEYARVCQNSTRKVDQFARLGGDEFGCILPGIDQHEALAMAERLRSLLLNHRIPYRESALQTTIGIGVITWNSTLQNGDELIYQLDQALLAAKREGKNRAVLA